MRKSEITTFSPREMVESMLLEAEWTVDADGVHGVYQCRDLDCEAMLERVLAHESGGLWVEFSLSVTFPRSATESDFEVIEMFRTRASVMDIVIEYDTDEADVRMVIGVVLPDGDDIVDVFRTFVMFPFAEFVIMFLDHEKMPETFTQMLCLERVDTNTLQ